jgi:hypothetical protein
MLRYKGSRIFFIAVKLIYILFLQGCRMNYSTAPSENVRISRRPELLDEGKRLTILMCGSCHYNEKTKSLSGKRLMDTPAIVGKIYSANLTNDSSSALFRYSDKELKFLLRTGISKAGKVTPYMLRPNMSDEDIAAIITFLRSDDDLVGPKPTTVGKTRYTPVGKIAMSRTKPVPYSSEPLSRPTDALSLGRYLVDNLGCYHCHSKSFLSLQYQFPEQSSGFMGGGNKIKGADGKTIRTPNLTFHKTGLAEWTKDDLATLLRQGVTPDKRIVRYPMPLFPELTDREISSIYSYLNQLPKIKNEVR